MLNILTEEADKSIESSYEKGYKEGVLEYKPEVEYWKSLYQESQNLCTTEKLKYGLVGGFIGFSVGTVSTIVLKIKI